VNLDAYWCKVWQWCHGVQRGLSNGIIFKALILKWTRRMAINAVNHSYEILGAGMLWKPKEARILTNFIDQPVNIR
jgi:hypothetical protein